MALAACTSLVAAPAWAARVVDVRVGQHPGFSRLVFELDTPAGYKVERSTTGGVYELVVSLDAAAGAETLDKKLEFIERVQVVPGSRDRSTARVRLKGRELRLKEMILANPPRIVLDVLSDTAVAEARTKPTQKQKTAAAQTKRSAGDEAGASREKADQEARAKAAEEARAKAAAQAEAAAEAKAAEQAKAAAAKQAKKKAKAEARARAAAVEKAKAEEARAAEAKARAEAEEMALEKARLTAQPPASMPPGNGEAEGVKIAMAGSPSDARTAVRPGTVPGARTPTPPTSDGAAARPAPVPAATARPKATPPAPAAASGLGTDGALMSTTNIAVGAGGLLLLVAAAFVFMRRRRSAEVVDDSAFESPLSDDDNPFASLDPAVAEAETEEIPISEGAQVEVGVPIEEADAEPQGGANVDLGTDNSSTMGNSPPAGMGGGADVSSLVADFERRMAAMESRVNELVEAKERLERQVAAQTEELRVQRAAIARTQRAVRNLSRPGEDAPTEPALRDPSRPEGPRDS